MKNGRGRVQFTHQELEAIRILSRDRLKGTLTIGSKLRDTTLGSLLVKVDRASNRLKALG